MNCHKCKKEYSTRGREGSNYCSNTCEVLAIEDWKRNPGTKFNSVDFKEIEEHKNMLWEKSAYRLNNK